MKKTKEVKEEEKEEEIDTIAQTIHDEREYYLTTSREKRHKWVECWKMYISYLETGSNPFLANMFIPKSHEAVELLAAFLIGSNQSINVEAEGKEDVIKEPLIQKWLDFQWRKTLNMRQKLLSWIKQGIIFGNGIIKAGWDEEDKEPYAVTLPLPDVYFDYFSNSIQDSQSVIHRIIKNTKEVQNDERYNENKKMVIDTSEMQDTADSRFSAYDSTVNAQNPEGVTELLERWTNDKVITIAPTSLGWKVIREMENKYEDSDGKKYKPFVKLRFKTNPLPNRAYDTGAIEPTIHLQKAFNDLLNELFDNVALTNETMWQVRRGAAVNPMDLIARPGGIVEVDDINADIAPLIAGDIRNSGVEMLRMIDAEFQQASMVTNLLKGVPDAKFATEAAINQSNAQTLMDMIDQNIKDALSELGQMILNINLQYGKGVRSFRVMDNDKQAVFAEVDLKDISGKYDIKISSDRANATSKAVIQKQLLDMIMIVAKDAMTLQKYPDLLTKLYKKWLQDSAVGNVDYYFEETQTQMGGGTSGVSPNMPPNQPPASPMQGMFNSPTPNTGQGLSLQSQIQGIMK